MKSECSAVRDLFCDLSDFCVCYKVKKKLGDYPLSVETPQIVALFLFSPQHYMEDVSNLRQVLWSSRNPNLSANYLCYIPQLLVEVWMHCGVNNHYIDYGTLNLEMNNSKPNKSVCINCKYFLLTTSIICRRWQCLAYLVPSWRWCSQLPYSQNVKDGWLIFCFDFTMKQNSIFSTFSVPIKQRREFNLSTIPPVLVSEKL